MYYTYCDLKKTTAHSCLSSESQNSSFTPYRNFKWDQNFYWVTPTSKHKGFFFFNDCHQPWSMNSHSWGCLQAAAPSQKSTAGCSLLFPIIAKLWLHLTLVSYITQPFIIAGNPFLKPRPTQQKYVASPPKLIWFKVSRIDSWRFCTTHTIFLLGDPELLWLDSSGLSPPSWSCQSAAGHNPSW